MADNQAVDRETLDGFEKLKPDLEVLWKVADPMPEHFAAIQKLGSAYGNIFAAAAAHEEEARRLLESLPSEK